MTEMTDTFLTGMLAYGAPALSVALLLGAVGLPLPGAMFLLAAGAFARQGALDWRLPIPLTLAGVVVGDSGGYFLGRRAVPLVIKRVEKTSAWQKAQTTFKRWGGVAVFLTRFLFTPMAVPTNLVAGSSRYPYGRFLLFTVAGEVLWVALYGALGYLFADSWEMLNDLVGNLSGVLVGAVLLGAGGYIAIMYGRATAHRG
jgi:membrane protein DedA with SNARE-associated domain